MVTLIIFLFTLSVLIVVHELGHFIAAKKNGVRVEKFSLGFGPRLLKIERGGTEYTLSLIPLGGYVKLAGDSLEEYSGKKEEYFNQPVGRRFQIIACGPLFNYLLGFILFWFIFFAGYPSLTTKIGALLDGFGAKEAGLEIGDKITAVDGQPVAVWEELQEIIRNKKTQDKVRVSFLRAGQELSADVRIREKQLDDQLGQKRNVGLLGISASPDVIRVKHSFGSSFFLAIDKCLSLTVLTYKGLWRMITGKISIRDSVSGPLGIFYITSQAASLGIIVLLHLLAVLSISLAIFNLLPLPVLDGGHILFLGLEKIRGKNFGIKTEQVITKIGLTLVISLAVLVTYNDILRLYADKITKFFAK